MKNLIAIVCLLTVCPVFGEHPEERFSAMSADQKRSFEIEVMEKVADLALIPPKLNTSPLPKYDYDQLAYGMTIGIARTPGGRLWACWVAGEDGAKAFFVCATSDNDGETWSKPVLVIDGQSDKLPMPRSVLVGNLWTDPLGRLWIFFNQSMAQFDGRSGVWAAICENPDDAKPVWTAPKRIWHGFTLNKPTVLGNGDWLLPISLNRAGFGPFNGAFKELDPFRGANAFLSKDHGATWQRQGHVQFPNPDWDEHSFIERKDGSLWMVARTGQGPMQSFSTDFGKTWSAPTVVETFSHPLGRLHLRRLASGRLLLVKHGEAIDTNHGRKQISAWLSDDEGKTWQGGLMLDERDGVSYPDGFQSPDGTIYISYDHNRSTDGEILMARFTEEDILAKKLVGPKSKLKMLISRPLKTKTEVAAPAKSAAAATPPPVNQAPIRISPLHFRPKAGNAGDVIPFYWQDQYHVFYLSKEGLEWAHAVSTDLTHWRELPPAVTRGSSERDPDGQNCWTGSIAEKDGTFHLFYTGQNVFDPKGEQKVMVATSTDLIRWEKQPQRTLYADGKIYWSKPVNGPAASVTSHHQAFRDADVFWNKDAHRWWMVLHALTAEGHRPCFGLYTSADIIQWAPQTPLGTYAMGVGLDCPNVMPMLGRWFVIASQAHFASATEAEGPYAPADMQPYESGDLVVPKSLFDGKRRLIWGWIRDLKGARDSGEGLWGGTLSLPREIYPGPDGQIFSRPAAEVTAAFTTTALDLASKPAPGDTIGKWQYADKNLVCGSEGGACSFKVPDDYLLQCSVELDPKASLTVSMRQRQAGRGYPLLIHPENRLVSLKRGSSEFSRRVEFDVAQPVTIQAFVQGAILECFINDRHAFTCRAYDFPTGNLGLKVAGGQMKVLDLKVKKLPPRQL